MDLVPVLIMVPITCWFLILAFLPEIGCLLDGHEISQEYAMKQLVAAELRHFGRTNRTNINLSIIMSRCIGTLYFGTSVYWCLKESLILLIMAMLVTWAAFKNADTLEEIRGKAYGA